MTELTADRPSILDVANHCGLSKATVSKALNAPADSKLVSAKTRAHARINASSLRLVRST